MGIARIIQVIGMGKPMVWGSHILEPPHIKTSPALLTQSSADVFIFSLICMFHERCCRPFKRNRHGHMYATPYTGSHLPSCKKLQEAFEARQVLFPRPSGHISWCFSQEQRELADAHSAKVNEAAWDPRIIRMQGPKVSRATTW